MEKIWPTSLWAFPLYWESFEGPCDHQSLVSVFADVDVPVYRCVFTTSLDHSLGICLLESYSYGRPSLCWWWRLSPIIHSSHLSFHWCPKVVLPGLTLLLSCYPLALFFIMLWTLVSYFTYVFAQNSTKCCTAFQCSKIMLSSCWAQIFYMVFPISAGVVFQQNTVLSLAQVENGAFFTLSICSFLLTYFWVKPTSPNYAKCIVCTILVKSPYVVKLINSSTSCMSQLPLKNWCGARVCFQDTYICQLF